MNYKPRDVGRWPLAARLGSTVAGPENLRGLENPGKVDGAALKMQLDRQDFSNRRRQTSPAAAARAARKPARGRKHPLAGTRRLGRRVASSETLPRRQSGATPAPISNP